MVVHRRLHAIQTCSNDPIKAGCVPKQASKHVPRSTLTKLPNLTHLSSQRNCKSGHQSVVLHPQRIVRKLSLSFVTSSFPSPGTYHWACIPESDTGRRARYSMCATSHHRPPAAGQARQVLSVYSLARGLLSTLCRVPRSGYVAPRCLSRRVAWSDSSSSQPTTPCGPARGGALKSAKNAKLASRVLYPKLYCGRVRSRCPVSCSQQHHMRCAARLRCPDALSTRARWRPHSLRRLLA